MGNTKTGAANRRKLARREAAATRQAAYGLLSLDQKLKRAAANGNGKELERLLQRKRVEAANG